MAKHRRGANLPKVTANDILMASNILNRTASEKEAQVISMRYNKIMRLSGYYGALRKYLKSIGMNFKEDYFLDTPTGLYFADFLISRKNVIIQLQLSHSHIPAMLSEFKRYGYSVLMLNKKDFKDFSYPDKINEILNLNL